ncbi:hypothetical protein [Lichenicoccus sp.]|uniref:hypothetical protein n=1 Tax=Lichenicoccus sp. TaxID=2781899 RepID=UPI003D14BA82
MVRRAAARAWRRAGNGDTATLADDIFKEIDEELRAERLRATGRRYGAAAIAAVLVVAAGVGFWQFQLWRQGQAAQATASVFFAAMQQADSSRAAGGSAAMRAVPLFEQVQRDGPEGFRTLARFRQAQIVWDAGDHKAALALWSAIDQDAAADPDLRGLADLLWVQHQVDDGDPALLESHLGTLSRPGAPWRPMAQELDALIDLRTGHVAEARRTLAMLGEDGAASEDLRNRAAGLNETLDDTRPADATGPAPKKSPG